MKLAYICSPYAGNISENVHFAKAACRFAIGQGYAPIAPHLLYPQLLNDAVPAERSIGTQMGLRLLSACDELWICGPTISFGMNQEIAEAKRLGIPIRTASAQQIQENGPQKQFGILARRSAASVCGAAEAWVKQDGKPMIFGSYEDAAAEAHRLNAGMWPINRTVRYFPKGRGSMPEEAPDFGMKLQP